MTKELAIHGGSPAITTTEEQYVWPVITDQTKMAVTDQLFETISIYDNSGVIGRFEKKFSDYHGRKYGLLSNSGTSSILAMYEAIGVAPNDEVLCPVYTFHATVSPMMYLGGTPVFCDSDESGNVTLSEIVKRTTSSTKAVIVTHMWGQPVEEIESIANYCKEKGLYLLEDCSHAHGAMINGKKVGTFGDMAAWSLQGQKIISGGEGGILLTDQEDLYYRALLQGHYNKRPKNEIDQNNPLHQFFLTGFGLKLRAHPIATAIAEEQFGQLDNFMKYKQQYASKISSALSKYPFLRMPVSTDEIVPSWYAYGFNFVPREDIECTRQEFVDALLAEGLSEVDIPGSTGLLNNLPLFTHPNKVLPRFYKSPLSRQDNYPRAQQFYDSFVKLPVWAHEKDSAMVDGYIKGIQKIGDYVLKNGSLSRSS